MRLLFVIHQFFPDCHSGTEQYCLAIAREARRRGEDVTVLSLHWDHDRDWPPIGLIEAPYDGFRVLRLHHWRQINRNDVLRDYENRHLEGWFRAVLDDVRPDAVHFFHLRQLGANLIPVAKAAGARTVVNLMDFWFLCPRFTLLRPDGEVCNGPPGEGIGCVACNHPERGGAAPAPGHAAMKSEPAARLRALLDRKQVLLAHLAMANAVVAPSRFLAQMFVQNGFPSARLTVVPYGLDPDRIVPLPAARPRVPLRLAFCGVLSPWKAPHVAVDAVRMVTADVRLTIHGRLAEPTFTAYIEDLRRRAGGDPRIGFADAYAAPDAPAVFAAMDVLIVPSTWYENTPFVVLEAFAAGVPVIASDLGGLSEVVRDGENGLLVRPGDAAALAAAITRLTEAPALYASLRPTAPASTVADYERFRALYR